MNICLIGKYPPIQGGVSRENFWSTYALAQKNSLVHVVTNAQEVEYQFRIFDQIWKADDSPTADVVRRGNLMIHTSTGSGNSSFIPWANPFVTKLASIATDVVEKYSCELIYSFYLEPYALAAYLASQWTGVPFGYRHAGSDVGRLFSLPESRTAYTQVIQSADFIFASESMFRQFLHLGVDLDRLYPSIQFCLPTQYFNPSAKPLDVNWLANEVKNNFPKDSFQGAFNRLADKEFDPKLPTFGIYGKTGRTKGSFDLLRALRTLKLQGYKFNFVALTQGYSQTVLELVRSIEENSLQDVTWLFPFIPHWYIPNFLRTCTAVCFLERDFPIKLHRPIIPLEVFACGTSLILSDEIANKQVYRDKLVNTSNVFLVDPRNTDDLVNILRRIIDTSGLAEEVGIKGYIEVFSTLNQNFETYSENLVKVFTSIKSEARYGRSLMSVAEMQACLARLYVDDSFRKLFYLDANVALDGYKLSELERTAINDIDRKMLDFFSASLKHKRKKRFEAAYPLLFKLGRHEVDRYFDRYYHLYPARPNENTLNQILEFGRFMEETLAADRDFPPFAVDLVRYERLHYATKFSPSPRDSFERINSDNSLPTAPISPDAHLFMRDGIQIATFKYDIAKIVVALNDDDPMTELQEGEFFYAFQQIANSLRPKIFAISQATYVLVTLCDGSPTLLELVGQMGQVLGESDLEDEIIEIVTHLSDLGVVGVR